MKNLTKIIRFLLFLSPVIFPAYLLRFQVTSIPFTALEIFIYILFGLWIINIIADKKTIVWDRFTKRYWLSAFAIILGATIGVIAAPDFIRLPDGNIINAKMTALGIWKGWVVVPALYFAVLTQMLKTSEDVKKILKVFICSAALVALVSHGLAFQGSGLTMDFRLSGIFESANYLALYIIPALLISLYFFIEKKYTAGLWNYINTVSLTILTYSLFFTRSYAGVIAVFGSIGIYILYILIKNKKYRKKAVIALSALAMIFIIAVASQIKTPKFRQFLDFENRSSTTVRLEIYRTSWQMIKDHPVTGVGPGLFQANYQNRAPDVLGRPPMEWNMPHPHNIFLGFWLSAGIIGLFAFITLIIFCHTKFTYPLIALWGIFIHGLFDMPFWKNDLAMIFWLVIASVIILQRPDRQF